MSTIKKYMKLHLYEIDEDVFSSDEEMKNAIEKLTKTIMSLPYNQLSQTQAKQTAINALLGINYLSELDEEIKTGNHHYYSEDATIVKNMSPEEQRIANYNKSELKSYTLVKTIKSARRW